VYYDIEAQGTVLSARPPVIDYFDYLVPHEDLLSLAEVEQDLSFAAPWAFCSSLSGIAPALLALDGLEEGALF